MGMFDTILLDVSCPECGNYVTHEFQTKSLECLLDTYRPGDMVDSRKLKSITVYTTCVHQVEIEKYEDGAIHARVSGLWIEYDIPVVDGIIARDQNTWVRRTEPSSYNSLSFVSRDLTLGDIMLRAVDKNRKIRNDILITKWEQTHIGR
jgi:hypothetical protein